MACKIAYPFPTHCCDPRQSASVLKIKAVVLLLLILGNDRAFHKHYITICIANFLRYFYLHSISWHMP